MRRSSPCSAGAEGLARGTLGPCPPENRAVAAGSSLAALAFTLAVACFERRPHRAGDHAIPDSPRLCLGVHDLPDLLGGLGSRRRRTGGPGDDADHWRAEAKRLQATLDDPQKVEQYYTEKAAKEYAAAKVETLDLKDAATKGPEGAPVKVVVYSDFLCPFCRDLARGLHNFLPQTGDRIQLVYKNYPLDLTCNPKLQRTVHNGACNLALGAICAQDQGKFWPYHDRAFAGAGENPKPEDVVRIAGEAGLDGAALGTCMAAPRTKERLTAQIEEARRLGVQSTPTLYINGKKLPRINDFVQVVDKEAQAKGFPPLPTGPPGH